MKSLIAATFLFYGLFFTPSLKSQSPATAPENLPDFKFQSVLSTPFTPENLAKKKPVIVVYFDPDCDHCQKQATWIAEKIESFNSINLIFVSWAEQTANLKFAETYFGKVKEKVTPGMLNFTKDADYKIDSWFGYSEVPSIYIYGSDWKHKQSFKKETTVEDLLKWAK